MDDNKGLKLPELSDSDANIQNPRINGPMAISVEGYDTKLHAYALKLALRKHFSSCGKYVHVVVQIDFENGILKRVSFMRIDGEGAEDKALQLNGTDVGGWTVIVKAAPWMKELSEPWCPAKAERRAKEQIVRLKRYGASSLPAIDIEIALCKHLSSCGEVTQIILLPSSARVTIIGEGCEEKALKLSECNVGGMTFVVTPIQFNPEAVRLRSLSTNLTGYMRPGPKKMKMVKMEKKKMKMKIKKVEMKMEKMDMNLEKKKTKHKALS